MQNRFNARGTTMDRPRSRLPRVTTPRQDRISSFNVYIYVKVSVQALQQLEQFLGYIECHPKLVEGVEQKLI